MFRLVHHVGYDSACRRKFSRSASIKHRVPEHISVHKNRIEHIIDVVKRMVTAKKMRRYDRMQVIAVSSARRKQFDRHAHFLCVQHIFFCDLRDPLGINILKIHLTTGDQ